MSDDLELRERVGAELLRVAGGDPFSIVVDGADEHPSGTWIRAELGVLVKL